MIEKALLEAYSEDIPNDFMAILLSAINGDVTWEIQTEEQLSKLVESLEMISNTFIYYYYDYKDNWSLQNISEDYLEEDITENIINADTCDFCISTDCWEVLCEKLDTGFNITFSILDKEKLEQALKSYFVRYEENTLLCDYGNPLHRNDYDKLLYNLMTEYDYNLFQFHITDIKYVKPIFYNMLIQNSIVLYETTIELNKDSQITNFDCVIDGRYFVEEYKEQKICSNTPLLTDKETKIKQRKKAPNAIKSRYHMQPKQWKLFLCLLDAAIKLKANRIQTGEISKEKLIRNGVLSDSTGAQDTAKTRFNDVYNQIRGNKQGEYEDLIYPKVSDTRYYEFDVSRVINFYDNIKHNNYLEEELKKHKYFISQIVD